MSRMRVCVATLAFLSLAIFVTLLLWSETRDPATLLLAARTALANGEYNSATELSRQLVPEDGDYFSDAMLILGEAEQRLMHLDAAAEQYLRIPNDGSRTSQLGRYTAGIIRLHQGRLEDSEQLFSDVLSHDKGHFAAEKQLSNLLLMQGRNWESEPYLFELVRNDHFTFDSLMYLADIGQFVTFPSELSEMSKADPKDSGLLLGLASVDIESGQPDTAETRLRKVLAVRPELIEAHVRLGSILIERSDEEFQEWWKQLPQAASRHPGMWNVLGMRMRQTGHMPEAVRCFWEAARLDPNNRAAHYSLGQLLTALGRESEASSYRRRAEMLEQLGAVIQGMYDHPGDLSEMQKIIALMDQLGRSWEAWAWTKTMLATAGYDPSTSSDVMRMYLNLRSENATRTLDQFVVARQFELSHFPLPVPQLPAQSSVEVLALMSTQLKFEDRAQQLGVKFSYFNSADAATEGMRFLEFPGGGVGVLDFDCDCWPDLYFSQGCELPALADSAVYRDELFRNLRGKTFEAVSAVSGLGDTEFTHGVASGDIDNDGFPDVFLANIGGNKLYRNNGDGTLVDITNASPQLAGDEWTISAAIVDLDADGMPEIYAVNYLSGKNILMQICSHDGVSRACSPGGFDAEQDRLYLNSGDGRFSDITATSGIVAADGKGLGIQAADFDSDGRIELFIANDAVANFYFVPSAIGGELKFSNNALPAGLAFDADGKAQACMGVGADDVNADGLLDLFVTNFYQESNTLYEQLSRGFFIDSTRKFRLRTPSFNWLGFGTQFFDADLDGISEIVITNGHVDDFRFKGTPYHMPSQVLKQVGDGTYVEVPQESLGGFFQHDYLGRGLATLDWNRDGREDFAVSFLESPVAVVANESETTNHYCSIRLSGRGCSRDAIGTRVRVVTETNTARTLQLTAGNGYQASCEHHLLFGLGPSDTIRQLDITWPNGTQQSYRNIRSDQEYVIVEGIRQVFVQPK